LFNHCTANREFTVLPTSVVGVKRAATLRCVFVSLAIALVPAALTQCHPSAQGADATPQAAQFPNVSRIAGVSRGAPALVKPSGDTKDQVLRYGLGLIFQVAPRTAAASCNIRTVGAGHWDFEDGSDVVVFDDIATIARQKRIAIARNEEDRDPATGRKRIAVNYPVFVGFVPLAAKRPDGSAHPGAGTGFGISHALCFELNDQGFFTWDQTPREHRYYVRQFAYDGHDFRVVKTEKKSAGKPLKIADGAWAITAPGMSAAIPDGDDLLLAVSASDGTRESAGVSRWRRRQGDWAPVAFYGVSGGMEPSLVRDIDGSLLYSVRGTGREGQAVRVWRSVDSGRNWEQVLHVPTLRSDAPVVLNRAADGTAYLAANHPDSFRAKLCLWPLNAQRTGCGPAIVARDCVGEFGPPPVGTTWFADHPMATTVQLADGRWHNLLGYRVMAFSTKGVGGEKLTPRTGCYIEEVFSTAPARPTWRL